MTVVDVAQNDHRGTYNVLLCEFHEPTVIFTLPQSRMTEFIYYAIPCLFLTDFQVQGLKRSKKGRAGFFAQFSFKQTSPKCQHDGNIPTFHKQAISQRLKQVLICLYKETIYASN